LKKRKKPSWNKGFKAGLSKEYLEDLRFQFKKLYIMDNMRARAWMLPLLRKIKGTWKYING
jgi:hypothetical protein